MDQTRDLGYELHNSFVTLGTMAIAYYFWFAQILVLAFIAMLVRCCVGNKLGCRKIRDQ